MNGFTNLDTQTVWVQVVEKASEKICREVPSTVECADDVAKEISRNFDCFAYFTRVERMPRLAH